MASSDLISSISSALTHLNLIGRGVRWSTNMTLAALELKIELRNVQMQLMISSRNLGDEDDLPSCFSGICLYAFQRVMCFNRLGDDLPSRFSGIEAAILKLGYGSDKLRIYGDALPEVRGFAKRLADECCTASLAVDDVVALANSIKENAADFSAFMSTFRWAYDIVKVDVIDAFVVQVTFLKCLLVLAMEAGAELQHLMIHFQPFAINAARVFIRDERAMLRDWYEEVNFKCSAATGMATAPKVYEAYSQALSASTFSSAPESVSVLENFLNSLISLLWDVLRSMLSSRVKDQLKVLYERLRFCRRILKLKAGGFDGVLVCGAGMLVCSLHHAHVHISYPDRLSELLERFGVLQANGETTAPIADELGSGDSAHVVEDVMISDGCEETAISDHQPQQAPQVAGFQNDEVNPVLDRLMRGSNQLQIVPICGMPGLGKTTFASALYNHRSIIYHFQSRAWCSISQVLDKRRVMLQLLDQNSGSYSDMSEDEIANKLRQSLKGKRYLIVLDDVWTTEAWYSLVTSFPDDSKQSRIIFTSRYCDVVPDQQPHLLRLRDDSECLEILKMKLYHQKGWTSELGLTIAKMCKGLPLMAVIVAGFLGATEPHGWKGILDHLSTSGVSGEKQCNNALELSFKHLPDDLKLCFLYFAAFPEDEEISVKRLLRLWLGEGLVIENESKRIEDVAREYMENLIQRSLVMVARNRSIGGVKTCRIHDLMRDFCLRKAKQENLFHILSQKDDELSDFNEPPNLRRLIIHSNPIHFKKARLFCPRAHSILMFSTTESYFFDVLFIIQIFKLLSVLDVHESSFTTEIPAEIELLTQLRYLSIRSKLSVIPSSLGNLPYLETFIGEFWKGSVIPFPHTFWNLHKLKCLCIKGPGFSLPAENFENNCALLELETLCGVVFNSYSSMEQQMRKIPNIRRLKCRILHGGESTPHSNKIVVLDFLNQVQYLTIQGYYRLLCEFGSSETLRRLTLDGFELSREEIADIGKLPNLEVLKLHAISFWDDTLYMREGEFSKLRYLKLDTISIERWTVSDELPCLQKLILHFFRVSKELPFDCLKTSAAIEEIQVYYCSRSVEDFAREIQEAQEDCGNLVNVSLSNLFENTVFNM